MFVGKQTREEFCQWFSGFDSKDGKADRRPALSHLSHWVNKDRSQEFEMTYTHKKKTVHKVNWSRESRTKKQPKC
jgi:hypothetical protein